MVVFFSWSQPSDLLMQVNDFDYIESIRIGSFIRSFAWLPLHSIAEQNTIFSALIKVSTEILIICLVKINKILCAFSSTARTNSTLSEHDRKKKKTQQLTCRMWYGSSLFVEDLALGCQIHSKRLLHGHIFCVVKLLFQLEIFMAVAEERRSPPELRHANKLVSKSIFFQPFALNTSPTTFLRKATNETYRFEMFRS